MSKISTQNKWLLAIVIVILINTAVWFLGLSPALDNIQAARKEVTRVEQKKTKLMQRLVMLDTIDTESLLKQKDSADGRIPEFGNVSEFLIDLEKSAGKHGLTVGTVLSATPALESPYYSMSFSIGVEGKYDGIYSYLRELESNNRLLTISNFSLAGSDDFVNCSISFKIYSENFNQLTPHQAPGRANPFSGR